ncbi:DUF3592 domain-containing protein [Hymenobacter sp. BT491]|uniref:DUF3592 domain-containing protein n=1 Tax=Hymenobacter sp. BT491 TaxID=2766779 RepID=UPI0016535EAD|nr:DUF3592 domain-containing protein [Hymenobacter sp. BT491]MBC6989453.1 DUF3592 domain-containing protein [Hymenobacter sp. BT491]
MFSLEQTDKDFILSILLGGCLLIVALLQWRKKAHLLQKGIAAEGVVIRMERAGNEEHEYPVIRFLTPENAWITARYELGTTPTGFKEGQAVRVRFEPTDPHQFTVEEDGAGWALLLIGAAGIGILVMGITKYLNT